MESDDRAVRGKPEESNRMPGGGERHADALEQRVEMRTAELADTNTTLQVQIAERELAESRVRELLAQQVQAVESERARISRDLHDTLGQHLAALALRMKTIAAMTASVAEVREHVASAHDLVRRIEDELDRLSYELRPPALDDLGLDEALRTHAQHWSSEAGVDIDLHSHGLRAARLPPVVETTVYRVVQETLTNIRKHAGATRVGLIVERRKDELRVIVEDDGCGFDSTSVVSGRGQHLGLRGMAERARLVAGQFEIESVPGRGTTAYLTIPIPADIDGPPSV